jgi:tRNA pseudouridine38-40 synthase
LRYFIELSYNGKNFHGWQYQPNAMSVQQTIEDSLEILLKQRIKILGAGRTDTGVHAKQMYAHFDFEDTLNLENLIYKLNAFLNKDIGIVNIHKVKPDSHARFDAISREYQYYITQKKDVYDYDKKYFFSKKLDFDKIDEAINILKKTKNFKSFCRTKSDVTNYNCDIYNFHYEKKDSEIIFIIRANRFLRNMVRSLIGTILDVSQDKILIKKLPEIIKKSNRIYAGPSVPAHALFLSNVEYPKTVFVK